MNDPRRIGSVQHVLGATVTVELDQDIAGVAPVVEGRLYPVGQIGSLVRIPQGPVSLIAAVTTLGISPDGAILVGPTALPAAKRWLQVQLLGEVTTGDDFRRGVSTYPTLNDPVLLVQDRDLERVFPPAGGTRVRIGQLAAAKGVEVSVDVRSLVMRHSAVLGSTGSGKSSCVSVLLQRIAFQWPAANIVVVDPHGEYAAALGATASVLSVTSTNPDTRLTVPYWALPASELLALAGSPIEGPNTPSRFAELVGEARRRFATKAKWELPNAEQIRPDTPTPFDLREIWLAIDDESRATVETKNDDATRRVVDAGDPVTLKRTVVEDYNQGGASPHQGPKWQHYRTTPDRIRNRLLDPRLDFFLAPLDELAVKEDPLPALMQTWLGRDKPISVLDFSGVPAESSDLAIGLVMKLLFDIAVRGDGDGIGKWRPVLIVLEEAHRYLGESQSTKIARAAANRIAREGRKHGVGLMWVTQRPSELPDTGLSQINTVFALRMTNAADQGRVKAALPDSLAGLADVLPSLRTGEAVVSGEAVSVPVRTVIDRASARPRAADPELVGWEGLSRANDVRGPLGRWRAEEGG